MLVLPYHLLSFWAIFFVRLSHYWRQKLKFGKNVKKPWRYYPFTHVYHKWRSYDVWHGRQFFVILGHFLPSDPLNNQKNENFERMKTVPEKLTFYTCVPQMIIIYKNTVWFMRYGVQQTDFLSFWTIFCPFTPPPTP